MHLRSLVAAAIGEADGAPAKVPEHPVRHAALGALWVTCRQFQQVQGWGQDIYGMQSALGGYGAYNSYQNSFGVTGTATVGK